MKRNELKRVWQCGKYKLTNMFTKKEIESALNADNGLIRENLKQYTYEGLENIILGGSAKKVRNSLINLRNHYIYEKVTEERARRGRKSVHRDVPYND